MNAAKRKHSVTHANAMLFLGNNYKEFKWLIDFDFQHLSEDALRVVRPDICGEKDGQIMVAVEISDSTLNHDINVKKDFYAAAGIQHYLIFDCDNTKIHQFELKGSSYIDSSYFKYQGDIAELFE